MLGLLILVGFAILVIFQRQTFSEVVADLPSKVSDKLDKLWMIAQDSLRSNKYLRAEKALLMILRIDERNATAYNRLGILYARQREFKDAIECFEIAQSLEPSASSLHNVGLIYYEAEKYDKAALAFEQALKIEEDVASRHIAYAKVHEKLNHPKKMLASLERAVELERTSQSLGILADAYERNGMHDKALDTREEVAKLVMAHNSKKRAAKKSKSSRSSNKDSADAKKRRRVVM
ncbi:tetratricopeptide repeat protein [Candidatus Nomurabacteria bacterium]|nr:tetratricopeptide repeat protein [Candidatus Nomurabacteria bacterium]